MKLFGRIRAALLIWKAASAQGRGDHREAAARAEEALRISPDSQAAAFLAAENSLHIRDHAGARRVLEDALDHHPGHMHFSVLLARTLERQGEPLEKIIPHVETYLRERRKTSDTLSGKARISRQILSGPAGSARVGESLQRSREALDRWAEELAARSEAGRSGGNGSLTKPPVSLT